MIDTVLFDLDGTLALMDQDQFIQTYFARLSALASSRGMDSERLVRAIWSGTKAMLENDGTQTNEERFWTVFPKAYGEDWKPAVPMLDHFYTHEFDSVREITQPNRLSRKLLQRLRRKGYKTVLATSPVFPRAATLLRINWAGLDPSDFDLITTYENCHYGKPAVGYYQEVLNGAGSIAQNCLMIGNDVDEDMCTASMGMETYLVTDYLLNRSNRPLESYRQGTFAEMAAYLETLPDLRYTYRRTAQYYETDQMAVVHHSNYIRWFEEARVQWMDEIGFGYDMMERQGLMSPVVSVQCEYKSPVRFHDTVLIRLKVTEFTGVRMTVQYEIMDEETEALRVTGISHHCFADGKTAHPVSLKKACPQAYEAFRAQLRTH